LKQRERNLTYRDDGRDTALDVPVLHEITEAIVRKILLAAALTSAFITGAVAQSYDPSPRDPPFGKGNPGNDTYHLPNQADLNGWGTTSGNATYGDPWRDTRGRRAPAPRTP
jgi:hypothetical protein